MQRWALATVALSAMLVPLNSTMVAVALPQLMRDFRTGIAQAGWLITGYLIAMACIQPVAGGLGDRYGRRRLMGGGLALFCLASLAATLAPTFWLLVCFRLGQAVAGALVVPNGVALVRELMPVAQRGSAFGFIGAAIGVGAATGPPLGGVLTHVGDWRALFALNVPVAGCLVLLSLWCLPRSAAGADDPPRAGFDLPGAVLLCLILAAIAFLAEDRAAGPLALALCLLTLAGLAALVVYELRRPQPVIDPRLFRDRGFSAATLGIALSNLAMYCMLLFVPQYLAAAGWNSAQAGLALVPLSGGLVIFGPPGGWLADRLGRRRPVVLGLLLLIAGSLALTRAVSDTTYSLLVVALALAGSGLGVAQSGLQSAAVEAVSIEQSGRAAGVYSTGRYLGSIVGTSLLATLLASNSGYGGVLLLISAAAFLAILAALALRDWPEAREAVQAEPSLVAATEAGSE